MKDKVIKITKIVIPILIVVVLFALWLSGRNVKVLEDVKVSDIDSIQLTISDYMIVTEQEDIGKILGILQSMELDRTYDKDIEGWAIIVDVFYNDGSDEFFTFYEDEVNADGDFYKCDSQFCDDLRELFFELEEKYPTQD